MVSHYDMITGEWIGVDEATARAAPAPQPAGLPALRLTTVQEAARLDPPAASRHTAVVLPLAAAPGLTPEA